jgi:hypothetical protein
MNGLFIISTDDGETRCNAMRLANVSEKKGWGVSVFMLGKGLLFDTCGGEGSFTRALARHPFFRLLYGLKNHDLCLGTHI